VRGFLMIGERGSRMRIPVRPERMRGRCASRKAAGATRSEAEGKLAAGGRSQSLPLRHHQTTPPCAGFFDDRGAGITDENS
jgi:hypothetical protein